MVHPLLCPSELFDAYFQEPKSASGSQNDVDEERRHEGGGQRSPLAHTPFRPFCHHVQGDHTAEAVDHDVEACCDNSRHH